MRPPWWTFVLPFTYNMRVKFCFFYTVSKRKMHKISFRPIILRRHRCDAFFFWNLERRNTKNLEKVRKGSWKNGSIATSITIHEMASTFFLPQFNMVQCSKHKQSLSKISFCKVLNLFSKIETLSFQIWIIFVEENLKNLTYLFRFGPLYNTFVVEDFAKIRVSS